VRVGLGDDVDDTLRALEKTEDDPADRDNDDVGVTEPVAELEKEVPDDIDDVPLGDTIGAPVRYTPRPYPTPVGAVGAHAPPLFVVV
jgi:hypothetical protein